VTEALSPRAREIVAVARVLLEHEGPDAVSMRAIATRLGIKAPSLYKHVPDKETLEVALIDEALGEVADAFEAAERDPDDAAWAVAVAYRRWALAHPHRYRLMMERSLPRARLTPGVEDRAAGVVVRVTGGRPDVARAAFAFAHGMVMLELNERFPPTADVTAAWRAGIDAFRPLPA
jgi:AcrR family transcriptional regulator